MSILNSLSVLSPHSSPLQHPVAYWPPTDLGSSSFSVLSFCLFILFINSWVRKTPWRRKWQPTPIYLPEKSDGQRSLAGYSPWGHKRVRHSWTTKQQQHIIIFLGNKICIYERVAHASFGNMPHLQKVGYSPSSKSTHSTSSLLANNHCSWANKEIPVTWEMGKR